jgi:hypothetical protein
VPEIARHQRDVGGGPVKGRRLCVHVCSCRGSGSVILSTLTLPRRPTNIPILAALLLFLKLIAPRHRCLSGLFCEPPPSLKTYYL